MTKIFRVVVMASVVSMIAIMMLAGCATSGSSRSNAVSEGNANASASSSASGSSASDSSDADVSASSDAGASSAASSTDADGNAGQEVDDDSGSDSTWSSACDADGNLPRQGSLYGVSYLVDPFGRHVEGLPERCYVLDEADNGRYYYTICCGERPTAGYDMKIVDIRANEKNQWDVTVMETSDENARIYEVITYPACVLALSSKPDAITFKDTRGVPFDPASLSQTR